MNNHLKAINNKDFVYDSDIKYFLIRILQVFDLGGNINISFAKLKDELGVTARVVHKGLEFLCENEVLIRQRNTGMQKRQVNCYVFGGRFRDAMLRTDEVKCQHKLKIDELLSPDKSTYKGVSESGINVYGGKLESKKHPLGMSSRLLLVVLLYHASSEGVVHSLSVTELASLSGQSVIAVKENIKRLKAQGYIRCSVGGVSNSLLFGSGVGHYYLNLSHQNFTSRERSIIVIDEAVYEAEGASIVGYAHYGDKSNKKPKVFKSGFLKTSLSQEGFDEISRLFKEKLNSGFEVYFQMKLQYFASVLLSGYWGDLKNPNGKVELVGIIKNNINKFDGFLMDTVCDFIYDVVLLIAVDATKAIVRAVDRADLDLKSMRYIIIPQPTHKGFFFNLVVQLFPLKNSDKAPCFYHFKEQDGVATSSCKKELPIDAQRQLNLFSGR